VTHTRQKPQKWYTLCSKIIKHYAVLVHLHTLPAHQYGPGPPTAGIGQSSSVMLDQNTHTMTTASSVKSVSNSPPLIFPLDPLQMCTLMTYWKIWPMANNRAAASR
jgi:hypothetical protein